MSELLFAFKGKSTIPNSGVSVGGLAYRKSTDTFFCINKNGFDPFVLQEIKLDEVTNKVTVVKVWGQINDANDRLKMKGKALVSMKGLWYDESKNGLWCSYGSFYANGENLPFLAFVKLNDDGTMSVYGPWKVSAATHSDKVKGIVFYTPENYFQATGFRFFAFGSRGSTSQGQSWGIGLVGLVEPNLDLPAYSELTSSVLIHWPMKTINTISQSEFPLIPGANSKYIKGNENVNPSAGSYSYQTNTFHDIVGGGSVTSVVKIKDNLFYLGSEGHGYQWYGNQYSHNDPTPAGIQYSNNIDSLIFPGKKTIGATTPRGGHMEEGVAVWYRIDMTDVPATQSQVSYKEAGKLSEFGITIDPAQTGYLGQMFYNEEKQKLYILSYGPTITYLNVKSKYVELSTGFSNLKATYNNSTNAVVFENEGQTVTKSVSMEEALSIIDQIKSSHGTAIAHQITDIFDMLKWGNLIPL